MFLSFSLFSDVGLESIKTMKSNPRKSAVYGSLGAFLCGCVLNNPDKDNFINQLLVTENFVGMVPETSQNPQAIKYLKYLNENLNKNTLRITSLGLFSVMWISDYSSNQATSDATCDYLSPEVSTFISTRVIDIGWWNNWWNLEKLTQDYDVNF